jgi:predicted small lipoprotein YifL
MKKLVLVLASLVTAFAITACGKPSSDHCSKPENKGQGECIGA